MKRCFPSHSPVDFPGAANGSVTRLTRDGTSGNNIVSTESGPGRSIKSTRRSIATLNSNFRATFNGATTNELMMTEFPFCAAVVYSGYYFGLWTRRFLVRVPSGCQYSMRLDRLHRAYPSLHPFGVLHWVPVLSNIKTVTGCESNRQLQLWTVFAWTVVNN